MTETGPPRDVRSEGSSANIIYILYLVSLVTGLTALIGVVMAYVYRNDAPEWVRTHYAFQIRTFWLAFVGALAGSLLSVILIGYLLLLFLAIWLVVRCVKGMQYLGRGEPHPHVDDYLFG